MYQSNTILTKYNIIVLLPQLSEIDTKKPSKEQEEVSSQQTVLTNNYLCHINIKEPNTNLKTLK